MPNLIYKNGMALKYADDKIKSNEFIVNKAVAKDGRALYYADDSLKSC